MNILPPILFCLLVMVGSSLTYCAHASEWRQGTDAEINRVMRLVYEGCAVIEGNPTSGNWRWKFVEKSGCR